MVKINFIQGLGLFMLASGGISFYIGNNKTGAVLALFGLILIGAGSEYRK